MCPVLYKNQNLQISFRVELLPHVWSGPWPTVGGKVAASLSPDFLHLGFLWPPGVEAFAFSGLHPPLPAEVPHAWQKPSGGSIPFRKSCCGFHIWSPGILDFWPLTCCWWGCNSISHTILWSTAMGDFFSACRLVSYPNPPHCPPKAGTGSEHFLSLF